MMHDCIQQETIGSLKKAVEILEGSCSKLFLMIETHVKDSPEFRDKIKTVEVEVKNMKEEKNNTTKASQWRVALIVGLIASLPSAFLSIILIIEKLKR